MQAPLYPYNNPYLYNNPYPCIPSDPYHPVPLKKEQSGLSIGLHILGGIFLGAIPLLVMLATMIIDDAADGNVLRDAATHSFLYTSLPVLLIAVICLFLKRRRLIVLALPIWVSTLVPASILIIMTYI